MTSLNQKIDELTSKYFRRDTTFELSGRKKLLARLLDLSDKLSPRQMEKGLLKVFEENREDTVSKFDEFTKDFEACKMSLEKENW